MRVLSGGIVASLRSSITRAAAFRTAGLSFTAAFRVGGPGLLFALATGALAATALVAVLVAALVAAAPGSALADIPRKISYQGVLVDGATGKPLVGSHDLAFGIFDSVEGGSSLWTESKTEEVDSNGVFSTPANPSRARESRRFYSSTMILLAAVSPPARSRMK